MKRKTLKIFFFICYLGFILGLMEFSLRLGGYQPWQIYRPMFSNMPEDDLEGDPQLGWRNRPGQFIYPDFLGTGVITLTQAADGTRLTSYEDLNVSEGAIWVAGDSFVLGEAISDHETFAWKLQEALPKIKVGNLGVPGYGTYQSMLMVEQHFARVSSPPKLVIYGFNDFHEPRNTASFAWLRGLTINSTRSDQVSLPYATLQEGQLQRHPPDKFSHWPYREKSSLITAFQDIYESLRTWQRSRQEVEVTRQILVEMNNMAQEHGSRFLVVLLTARDMPTKLSYTAFLQQQGIDHLDCTHPEYGAPELKVPLEGHPNEKMNFYWAECIMEYDLLLELRRL